METDRWIVWELRLIDAASRKRQHGPDAVFAYREWVYWQTVVGVHSGNIP